jgi:polysaccharide export outer membrane protein
MPLAVLAVVGLLAGCSTTGQPSSATTAGFAATDSQTTGSTTAAGAPSGPVATDYRIGALDTLDVSVFQVPDLSKTVQVSASGEISLPLIGTLQAGGKTIAELTADITKKYGASYLQSPQVSVMVREAVSQRVTVEGAVNKPGVYPTVGPTSLLQTIAIAGGLTEIADPGGVIVFRYVGAKRQAAKFDFSAIRAGKADDPQLQAGDTVVVDESGLKTTMRNIRQAIPVFGLFTPML